MREPVVVIVVRYLFLVTAIRLHSPDLHVSGALGVEINVSAVGRVLGAVVESGSSGQAGFLAACSGDGVYVEVVAALAGKGQGLSVRRPAVPVGGRVGGDEAGRSAGRRANRSKARCGWRRVTAPASFSLRWRTTGRELSRRRCARRSSQRA